MDPERYRRLKALLDAALDLEKNERAALLDRECASDPSMVEAIETLLHQRTHVGHGLGRSALGNLEHHVFGLVDGRANR